MRPVAGALALLLTLIPASVIRAAMEGEDVRVRLATVGAEVETTTPQEFARIIRAEIDRWAQVVKASGARAD